MSQIVHITFEKLTGLKGDIEGDFICIHDNAEKIDPRLPIILDAYCISKGSIVLRQGNTKIAVRPVESRFYMNFLDHFRYGTNFLIKSWSYGGGVTINSQPPN